MSAENCVACAKFDPGVPSALTIPSDSRLFTVSPVLGAYVAKRWSKERFSPTMTITCLMGEAVMASPVFALMGPAAKAGVTAGTRGSVDASHKDKVVLKALAHLTTMTARLMHIQRAPTVTWTP